MNLNKYHFLFNAACYFELMEKYPNGFFEVSMRSDRTGLEAVCWLLQKMSEQAEAVRKYMGLEGGEIFNAEEAMMLMMPLDIANARALVAAKVEAGMSVDSSDSNEELDLVLGELGKKIRPQE